MAGNEMSQDFSKVKVGDRLWARVNFYEGWCIVSQIGDHKEPYRLVVKYEIGNEDIFGSFTFEGENFLQGPQCLFWGPPEIIAPPMYNRAGDMPVVWKEKHTLEAKDDNAERT